MSYASINRGSFGGDRFTIVANAAIRDERLSYKARGLLALIASHREGWGVTEKQLAAKSPDGISAVRSGLKELEGAGYLRRYRVRDDLGRLGGAHWVITDDPASLDDRVATLAGALGEAGGDLVPLQMLRSDPKCDFPNLDNPTEGNPPEGNHTPKKTNHKNTSTKKKGEGEEGARERASETSPETEPTTPADNTDGDGWGIPATDRPTADTGTLFARTVIDSIAEATGLGLEPWQHRRLVLEHLPAALDAVRELADDRISGTELVEWLRDNLDTAQSLYAVLSTRCRPDYLSEALPVWVARTRTPGGLPGPSKPPARPAAPAAEDDAADADPFTRTGAPPTCRVHTGIALTADATGHRTRCHQCENLPAPAAPAPAPSPEDLADTIADAMGATSDPDLPPHCGARECHQAQRRIIRFDPAQAAHIDHGPCPRCHPDHAQEAA